MHQHLYIPSEHESFDRCLECGTYKNRIPFPKENYLDNYWDESKGHSTLQDQRHNLEVFVNENGETKVQAVLKHCVGKSILEVACAPGSFLFTAREAGFQCAGIEPDERYIANISAYSGCTVFKGFFEDISLGGGLSNIVAMDLLEHLEDGETFVQKAMSLLEVGGRLILMLPLADSCREQDFHPEHQFLYSRKFIEEWLRPVLVEEWLPGHSVVVIEK